MTWVAVAVGVGTVAVGAMQSGAASDAANAQAGAAANAQQISQQEFNTITAQNAPYMNSGYGALSALDWGLGIAPQTATGGVPSQGTPVQRGPTGINPGGISGFVGQGPIANFATTSQHDSRTMPGDIIAQQNQAAGGMGGLGGSGIPLGHESSRTLPQTGGLGFGSLTKPFDVSDWQQLSPAYNFQLQQGRQGVLNADTSGQGALSGSAMKDLIDYNQAAANTSFNSAFNQYQTQQGNIFSRLSGIAQLGQASANNTGQQGTALAGQAAQSATNIGTAQAGGIIGSSNAMAGGISSTLPWLMSGNFGTSSGGNVPWAGSGSKGGWEGAMGPPPG